MTTRIVLKEGLTLGTLPKAEVRTLVDQAQLLDRLYSMKSQWSEAVGGDLRRVEVNLKLLFEDFERIIQAS